MKYVGIYWTLFAPMMKKSIARRFDKELADRAIRQGKAEYKGLLARADDLGPGNPMAMNAYFAYVFAAAWLGSGRRITPDEMALVMTDVLEGSLLRTFFGLTDLNRKPKKWERDMRKYEAWFAAHGKDYPVNWNVNFDETRHQYHNLVCPLANFARKYGYEAYMPWLCNLDYVNFGLLGAPLYREHTCFEDGDYCDFKLKLDAKPLPYWPPVFSQDNPYK
jgi:hypothetical protein